MVIVIAFVARIVLVERHSALSPVVYTEEACKVRLNFAAYLSEGYRNREAVKVIKDSQRVENRRA